MAGAKVGNSNIPLNVKANVVTLVNLLGFANDARSQADVVSWLADVAHVARIGILDKPESGGMAPAFLSSVRRLRDLAMVAQGSLQDQGVTMALANSLWQEMNYLGNFIGLDQAPGNAEEKLAQASMAKINAQHEGWIGVSVFAAQGPAEAGVDVRVRDQFRQLKEFTFHADPLVLDLDGNGVTTISRDKQLYFDAKNEGIKTANGWVDANDGILVMDRNGNGAIDSGAELFGDRYILRDGSRAKDGFAALADQDSNGDGKIDKGDTAWSALRVWRDLNQDGISQADELFTLDKLGIASLSLERKGDAQNQANGNRITDTGKFTYSDGKTGSMANVDFAQDTFFRKFIKQVDIDAAVRELPGMRGAGRVRDLREAATLSPALREALEDYSSGQPGMLGGLLTAWADTSDMSHTLQERVGGKYNVVWKSLGGQPVSDDAAGRARVAELERKIHVIEAFNGQYFYDLHNAEARRSNGFNLVEGQGGKPGTITATLAARQIEMIENDYRILEASVSGALDMQKLFAGLLDQVRIDLSGKTPTLDMLAALRTLSAPQQVAFLQAMKSLASHLNAAGQAMFAASLAGLPQEYQDLLNRPIAIMTATLYGTDGDDVIRGTAGDDEIYGNAGNDNIDGLAGNDRIFGGAGNDAIKGGAGNDVLYGGAGNDTIDGGDGDDIIDGGDGDDVITDTTGYFNVIKGGAGNDIITGSATMEGGKGDDTIIAGNNSSNDVYIFNLGDGKDTILESALDNRFSTKDVLQLGKGIEADKTRLIRKGDDLVFRFNDDDQVTVKKWFAGSEYRIETIQFAEGRKWALDDISRMEIAIVDKNAEGKFQGGDENNLIEGTSGNDTINGGNGNNRLYGGAGNDTIEGGSGDDYIDGGDGDDVITDTAGYFNVIKGGAGNDTITGSATMEGGKGDDTIIAGNNTSNDVYIFNLGDGKDTITESAIANGYSAQDVLQLGKGIEADKTRLIRKGTDLVFRFNDDDQVTVKKWFAGSEYRIETIQFADGKKWTLDSISKMEIAIVDKNAEGKFQGGDENNLIEGTSGNDVISGGGGNDRLFGGAGNDTIDGEDGDDAIAGGDGDDKINGGGGNDRLFGGAGNDTIDGGDGDDTIEGGDGDDKIKSGSGNNKLYGGAGNDTIEGGSGDDYIDGGDGDDVITDTAGYFNVIKGGAGNDIITGSATMEGGKGDDTIIAGNNSSNDVYIFNLGDGKDTILESALNSGYSAQDVLKLGTGIEADKTRLIRKGTDLVFRFNDDDQVTVKNWFAGSQYRIETIQFADGKKWTLDDISRMSIAIDEKNAEGKFPGGDKWNLIEGTIGNDVINGGDGDDTIDGGKGDDKIYGGSGNDRLYGGAGNDIINGGDGEDTIDGGDGDDVITDTVGASVFRGGAGNDKITGHGSFEGGKGDDTLVSSWDASNDTYIFNLGDGKDTITDYGYSSSYSTNDVLKFGQGIDSANLWFRKNGKDLEISIVGSADGVVIKEWYTSSNYHIETIQLANGKNLKDTQVDALVQAMAAFTPPAAGQGTLPESYAAALNPVLAANWK